MVRFKKLAAVLLSAVMLVCCFTVQASAKSIYDKAPKINPMELISQSSTENTGAYWSTKDFYYKIVLSDSGKLTYSGESIYGNVYLWLLDSNGNNIVEHGSINGNVRIEKKGTYYFRIQLSGGTYHEGSSLKFADFYYGFQPDHTPTISLALNAKVGDEFDFSALTSNYSGKVTMKTTDSKVADVDGNIVTCKKAGKAKIRAYMNNGDYAEITLIVKKK